MTCPRCDCEDAVRVDHPGGVWLCAECAQLFDGGGVERLRMAPERAAYIRCRAEPVHGPPEPPAEGFSSLKRGQ